MMSIVTWAAAHPTLGIGIVVLALGAVIVVLAVRDARRKVRRVRAMDDVLLEMFKLALEEAERKAQSIVLDKKWEDTLKEIGKHIVGVDAEEYSGKDMTSKKQIAKIEKQVRKVSPTDEDTVPIYRAIANALENNDYGIQESLANHRRYRRLRKQLEQRRRVPSQAVNGAVNKCLDRLDILPNIYVHQKARMRNRVGLGQGTLASMREFIKAQDNNTGDMSNCLTELRVAVANFLGGENGG